MRRKKAQVSSTLVLMVAGLIGLLVLLAITGGFGKVVKTITGKSDCQMQFLISSFTKTGGAQTVEPECEPHLITVTEADLTKNQKAIEKNIKDYSDKYGVGSGKDNPTAVSYVSYFKENTKEWAMDKTIANEMKYCWDITGRGKLDLFSNWGIIQCKQGDGAFRPCTNDEMKKIYEENKGKALVSGMVGGILGVKTPVIGGITLGASSAIASAAAGPLIWERILGNIKEDTAPTFCVLCARIKFDEEVKNSFQNNEIKSMGAWLANNPVTDIGDYSKVSYAQYLQNDAFKGIWASNQGYSYTPNQAYAVLYTRVNTFGMPKYYDNFVTLASGATSSDVKDIQTIQLVEYKDIQNKCTVLIG
jgi:hypothetical protein